MNQRTKEVFSEVEAIIHALGEEYQKKLPEKLWQTIQQSKLESYTPHYQIETLATEKDIKRESIAMIALFHLNYWCESEEEKEQLKQLLEENERKQKQELKETYRLDKSHLHSPPEEKDEVRQQEAMEEKEQKTEMIKKESFWSGLLRKLFHRNNQK